MSDFDSGLPIRLRDEDNIAYSDTNPLPVSIEPSEGDEILDYDQAVGVLKNGGSSEHIYTVSASKTLGFQKVLFGGSGRMKVEVQIETGVATDVFDTRAVAFSSTAKLSDEVNFGLEFSVVTGVKVKVIKTNLDNQDQDLYSTIVGVEK